jgi:hypothetical protein
MESHPNPCPRTCDGLLRLLATYQKLLTVQQLSTVREAAGREHRPAPMECPRGRPPVFLHPLLPDGTLPQSQLRCANAWLDSGSIKRIDGCPVDRLLGVSSAPAAAPPGPPAGAMTDWMPAATPEHYNNNVHPLLAAAVIPARNKRATIKVTDLINATTHPVPYSSVGVGIAGSCLDMNILGKCVNPQCMRFPVERERNQ